MTEKCTIAVWFSRGAASAAAAKLTTHLYGDDFDVRVLTSPVAEEPEDNVRFERDVAEWIGRPIEHVLNPKYPNASCVEVWNDRKAMSFPTGAPCTTQLKKEARYAYEADHRIDWHVLGFTYEEAKRHRRFTMTERSNVLPVLIDHRMTKQACINFLQLSGVRVPNIYKLGYPNANCIGCVKATSPTYWNLVRRTHPDVFASRAEQSRRLGVRLARHKGARVFLDELPSDAKGRPLASMDVECSSFCEERLD